MNFEADSLLEAARLYAPRVLLAIVLLVVGFWVATRLAGLVRRTLLARGVDPTVVPFVGSLVRVLFKGLVLLSAASMFGIEVTSFIAIFSALALAVGLALQSNLSHFASGLLLLTLRPYKVGDVVTVGGMTGKVEEIQVFHTILSTPDNQRHVVPNGKVTGDTITNLSGQGTRGVELNFGIGYDDDIDTAREIVLATIAEHEHVLPEPKATVVVTGLGDSAVGIMARPFVLSQNWWQTKVELTERCKVALERGGITIPFPQRTVWVRGGAGSASGQVGGDEEADWSGGGVGS